MLKQFNCSECQGGFSYETTGGRPRKYCKRCAGAIHLAASKSKRGLCVDCGTPIRRSVGRCRSCARRQVRGDRHYAYKGGAHRLPSGYIYLSGHQGHPNANRVGQIPQHTLVMTQKLGRPLVKGESAHHLNGIRDDNRPENLELWSRAQPAGQRVEDKLAFAIEIVQLYAPELLKESPCVLPSPVGRGSSGVT